MNIMKSYKTTGRLVALVSIMVMSCALQAEIPGLTGPAFSLFAKQGQISTPDGDSLRIWGFAPNETAQTQYPGPTLIVTEGDTVMVTVENTDVPQPISMVFPGQGNISKACTRNGNPVNCAGPLFDNLNVLPTNPSGFEFDSITYSFVASKPGTYMYHSGSSPQIQIDMGLVGALIVRPDPVDNPTPANAVGLAYNNEATAYDREYLFLLSEMDPRLHYLAENDALGQWDNADYKSVLFFINGRNAPDTLAPNDHPALHHQPYGSIVKMYPGERVLIRVLNAGRNQHPLHLHGNHFDQIARDGNLLMTDDGTNIGPITDYTLGAVPGSTADLLFEWTGKGMGWDIYNSESPHGDCHLAGDPNNTTDLINNRTGAAGADGFHDVTWEYCADHGKPLPVVIPENQDLAFGGFYGGSPYLGDMGSLPIGEGGLNPSGGMVFMWHSHSERELTNNDIYPGGMLTMMIVERCPADDLNPPAHCSSP